MMLPDISRWNLSYQCLDSVVVCKENFSTLCTEESIEGKHLI